MPMARAFSKARVADDSRGARPTGKPMKIEVIRALLGAGADPKKQDFSGRDALGWAAGRPASLRALQAARSG